MELFLAISGIVLTGGGLIFTGLYYGVIKPNKVSKLKLSDQQLLRLMYYHKGLTAKELSNMTSLTSTEAMARLHMLSNAQLVEYNMGFSTNTKVKCSLVSEVQEEIKIVDYLKFGNEKIDAHLIKLLASYSHGNISDTLLSLATGIELSKARKVLKSFKKQGLLSSAYNVYLQLEYKLAVSIEYLSLPLSEEQLKIVEVLKNPTGNIEGQVGVQSTHDDFSDAEIIKVIIANQGKLSATGLCLKKDISIETANNILESLHSKGVFDIKVSENGTIEYWLNDISLLS